jgi:hypothetical protein
MTHKDKHPCPCCRFLTLAGAPPGTFEICPICSWQDDDVQFGDPDYGGGSNQVSLRQARINFQTLRVSDPDSRVAVRDPTLDEIPQ